jgi:HAMP domain-containing protein
MLTAITRSRISKSSQVANKVAQLSGRRQVSMHSTASNFTVTVPQRPPPNLSQSHLDEVQQLKKELHRTTQELSLLQVKEGNVLIGCTN